MCGLQEKMVSPQELVFKSLVPEMLSSEDVYNEAGYALECQQYFERRLGIVCTHRYIRFTKLHNFSLNMSHALILVVL